MSKRTSLLLDLTDADFEAILDEFEYIFKRNYHCHYVLDVYEINQFCYPLGTRLDDQESINKTIGYLADEQYTFNRLFESRSEKVILLDEYIPELLSLKRIITNTTIEANHAAFSLKKYYTQLKDELPKLNHDEIKEIKEIIRTKLTQALAIILDTEHTGISKVINLIQKNKILYSISSKLTEDEPDILKEAFDKHKGSELTNVIFDTILNLDVYKYGPKETNLSAGAHFRDARVIDRISAINNYLYLLKETKRTKDVHLVYYLSSTVKSQRILSDKSILQNFPIIDNKRFNPLRNKKQLFLKYLCLSKTYKDSVENLRSLKERLQEVRMLLDSDLDNQVKGEEAIQELKNQYNHYREYFENDAILNKYAAIKEKLEDALGLLKNNKTEEYLIKIAEHIKIAGEKTKETTIDKLIGLNEWAVQIRFSLFINSYLANAEDNEIRLNISTGKDRVRGTVQHLPVLISFTDSKLNKKFEYLVSRLILPAKELVLSSVENLTLEDRTDENLDSRYYYEEKLFKAFCLLLVPPEIFPNENINEIICDWLTIVLTTNINKKERRGEYEVIQKNYYYFIGWQLRRANQIEASVKWFQGALKLFPEEGRYFHGLCLSEYCLFESKKDVGKIEFDLLFSAISNAKEAIKKYDTEQIEYSNSKIALMNTIAYCYALIFENDPIKTSKRAKAFLKLARTNFDEVKKVAGKAYKKYPEYLHTEAIVNFNEYILNIILYQDKKLIKYKEEALDKISIATDAIIDSVEIDDAPQILIDKKRYHNLQVKIAKEKQEFMKKYFKTAKK